jgi:hypothetical protein
MVQHQSRHDTGRRRNKIFSRRQRSEFSAAVLRNSSLSTQRFVSYKVSDDAKIVDGACDVASKSAVNPVFQIFLGAF